MAERRAVPLSPRQRAVLEFLIAYRREHGYMPTIIEIAEAFGIHSTNGVVSHLLRLEHKGYIRRAYNGHRAISLLMAVAPGLDDDLNVPARTSL